MALASEKGASTLLTALPLKRYGFDLTKTEFRDCLTLRYVLQPKNFPLKCSCGENFKVSHALHCGKGGYAHIRHNGVRDTFAKVMRSLLRCRIRAEFSGLLKASPSITEPHALQMKPASISRPAGFPLFPYIFDVKIFNRHAASCSRNIKH